MLNNRYESHNECRDHRRRRGECRYHRMNVDIMNVDIIGKKRWTFMVYNYVMTCREGSRCQSL